jgi:glycosyltransferase involved in cell wall biosynthesis
VRVRAFDCTGRSALPGALAGLCRFARDTDAEILHGHLFEPTLLAALAAQRQGRCFLFTRHHSDALYRIGNPIKRALYLSVERFLNHRARLVIAPARRVRDLLVEREGVPPSRVRLVPYPQSRQRFAAIRPEDIQRARHEISDGDAAVLVCVSRLHPEKGLPFLLEALSAITLSGRNVVLRIAGTGPERASLEKLATKLGLGGRVRFLGWRTDVLCLLAAADLVVHPSLQEALPSAVIEALALSKPVVATDVSGVPDILADGAYGRIVLPGDVESLRVGLEEALQDLEGMTVRAGHGSQAVLETMDAGRVAEAHLRCYEEALGR